MEHIIAAVCRISPFHDNIIQRFWIIILLLLLQQGLTRNYIHIDPHPIIYFISFRYHGSRALNPIKASRALRHCR